MPKIPLSQGAYQARSPIANAQVAINLYTEQNTQDAPFPVTHYPAPGLSVVQDFTGIFLPPGSPGFCRGLYVTSMGSIIAVIGRTVINLLGTSPLSWVVLGTMGVDTGNPVSICDNGTNTIVLVDGTTASPGVTAGYEIPLGSVTTPNSMVPITDEAFYGSNRVDYIDTFMIFNRPATQTLYTTTSNIVTPFDPTYTANKAGWNDHLMVAACLHDNIWLFGATTTEIWYNAGAAAFPFARMPNSILQQGTVAPNSVVITDNAVYWISQDRWGRNMCMRGEGYGAKRVSTYAVEDIWSKYEQLTDAIGMSYQLGGHETVAFYFPTGQAWWAYDVSAQMWHQRTYDGLTLPWLPFCMAGLGSVEFLNAPNMVLVGDRTGPRILQLSRNNYTDCGVPIVRQRSWSHIQADDGQRVSHQRFSASFAGAQLSPDTLTLDWSDDAGQTYGQPVNQTINDTYGQYQWRRLGYARDRVYRLTWTGAGECALNGAYVDITPHGT